jgi:ATP-dependent Zn protease
MIYIDHFLIKIAINSTTLAQRTSGFSGAELKNLVNISIIHAIKNGRDKAIHSDFDFAYDRTVMGIARRQIMGDDADKRATAYHESNLYFKTQSLTFY